MKKKNLINIGLTFIAILTFIGLFVLIGTQDIKEPDFSDLLLTEEIISEEDNAFEIFAQAAARINTILDNEGFEEHFYDKNKGYSNIAPILDSEDSQSVTRMIKKGLQRPRFVEKNQHLQGPSNLDSSFQKIKTAQNISKYLEL